MRLWVFALLLFFHPLMGWEVLTLGDPIIDHLIFVDEEFLSQIPGKKGGSELVDQQTFNQILQRSGKVPKRCAGGSAINMLKGLSRFGHNCAVIGKIGEDPEGAFFIDSLSKYGVTPLLQKSNAATGKLICLITPDKERTMRSCLTIETGCSNLSFSAELFKDLKLFHVEGYQIRTPELLTKVVDLAKAAGAKISMDLGCFELMNHHREFVLKLLDEKVDIVFANRDEAFALTQLPAAESCKKLSQICDIAIVTLGEKGGWVGKSGEIFYFDALPAPNVVDDTGAGDLFVSGFLHGYLIHAPLTNCAHMGATVAAEIVQEIGAELSEERWTKLLSKD